MNNYPSTLFVLLVLFLGFISCEKSEVVPVSNYDCNFSFADSSATHVKASRFQGILDDYRQQGIVGVTALIKDDNGMWIGASGMADIASGVKMKSCNRFLIGSVSKIFTAAAIFTYIDEGLLDLEDPVNKWVSTSITNEIANANDSKIKHLLSHRSGIPDFSNDIDYILDILNKDDFNRQQEDVLKYVYGKQASFGVDANFEYSNTGYVLLGLILEKVSGKSLEQVYIDRVFTPLGLESPYYSSSKPAPDDLVKSYIDLKNNGNFTESDYLDRDQLATADGGMASNAYDLAKFIEAIYKGNLISASSITHMQSWFDIPEVDKITGDLSHFQNGLGLEHYKTNHGNAIGHTGSVGGFWSFLHYFPEHDRSFVLLFNNRAASLEGAKVYLNLHNAFIEEMFKN